MASAKQKAAARRNIKKAQAARSSKRSSTRGVTKRSMPRKKRRSRSAVGGFRRAKSGIGGVLKSGVVGKVVQGIGAGSLAVLVLNRVAPQFAPIGGIAAGFLGGGLVGGAINLFLQGGLQNLGNIFGGQTSNGRGEAV